MIIEGMERPLAAAVLLRAISDVQNLQAPVRNRRDALEFLRSDWATTLAEICGITPSSLSVLTRRRRYVRHA